MPNSDELKSQVAMYLRKMQGTMTYLAKAVGYGYEMPEFHIAKGDKMPTDKELEEQVEGLATDLTELSKAVKDFVGEMADRPAAGIPDEVVKAIEDLKESIPSREDIKKMIDDAVEAALKAPATE